MIKQSISLIIIAISYPICTYAMDMNDLISPANPLENNTPINLISVPHKATLTKNDIHNQYAIALNKYIQSNVKSSYYDFKILLENTSPIDYLYLTMTEKMADLGFFDLSELAMSKLKDQDISYLLAEDVKTYYFPKVPLQKEDELYLAEMYSNILYNDQSKEVVEELTKTPILLEKYDYANYIAALGYLKSNDINSAEKYINIAIDRNPQNINYKKLKTEILSQSNKPQRAIKVVNSIKAETMLTKQFNNKIQSIVEYTLYKTQKDEFEKKYHLAYYFYLENELNKSMRTLQTAFNTKKSHNKNVYSLLSKVYYNMQEYEKATDNATKATKIDKSDSTALSVLGDLAYKNNHYKEAIQYYERAEQDVKAAQAYEKLGKTQKAYDIYAKILKTHSDSNLAYYQMALLDKSREVPYLKKSIAIDYTFKDGWIDLARCMIEKNNFDLASSYLSIAKYIDENDFRYYYYQGLIFKNKGLTADAKRYFRKSLMLNPNYTPAKEECNI